MHLAIFIKYDDTTCKYLTRRHEGTGRQMSLLHKPKAVCPCPKVGLLFTVTPAPTVHFPSIP